MKKVPRGQASHYINRPNPRANCEQDTYACPDADDPWRRAPCDEHILRKAKELWRELGATEDLPGLEPLMTLVLDIEALEPSAVLIVFDRGYKKFGICRRDDAPPVDLHEACAGRKVFTVGTAEAIAPFLRK